jgi:hypothetical protein
LRGINSCVSQGRARRARSRAHGTRMMRGAAFSIYSHVVLSPSLLLQAGAQRLRAACAQVIYKAVRAAAGVGGRVGSRWCMIRCGSSDSLSRHALTFSPRLSRCSAIARRMRRSSARPLGWRRGGLGARGAARRSMKVKKWGKCCQILHFMSTIVSLTLTLTHFCSSPSLNLPSLPHKDFLNLGITPPPKVCFILHFDSITYIKEYTFQS